MENVKVPGVVGDQELLVIAFRHDRGLWWDFKDASDFLVFVVHGTVTYKHCHTTTKAASDAYQPTFEETHTYIFRHTTYT